MRSGGASQFHFLNPTITSSAGNSSTSRGALPVISRQKSTDITSEIAVAAATAATVTTSTTTTSAAESMGKTINELTNRSISKSSGDSSSTAITDDIPSSSHTKSGTDEEACFGIRCQNNGTCTVGSDGRVNFNFTLSN